MLYNKQKEKSPVTSNQRLNESCFCGISCLIYITVKSDLVVPKGPFRALHPITCFSFCIFTGERVNLAIFLYFASCYGFFWHVLVTFLCLVETKPCSLFSETQSRLSLLFWFYQHRISLLWRMFFLAPYSYEALGFLMFLKNSSPLSWVWNQDFPRPGHVSPDHVWSIPESGMWPTWAIKIFPIIVQPGERNKERYFLTCNPLGNRKQVASYPPTPMQRKLISEHDTTDERLKKGLGREMGLVCLRVHSQRNHPTAWGYTNLLIQSVFA